MSQAQSPPPTPHMVRDMKKKGNGFGGSGIEKGE